MEDKISVNARVRVSIHLSFSSWYLFKKLAIFVFRGTTTATTTNPATDDHPNNWYTKNSIRGGKERKKL